MPALQAKTRRLIVANARHGPSYGCALRLDPTRCDVPFEHGQKLPGSDPTVDVCEN
ncbi:hypothetical protein [Hydrogenophaga sp. OTU3427]|uniref:hypothetical protein n=1 Tax=Hydrogenophaga sp. OTU3427 TaxID=3043856 RepID=UPI00313B2ABD